MKKETEEWLKGLDLTFLTNEEIAEVCERVLMLAEEELTFRIEQQDSRQA